jgi:hypothetical protein
MATATAEPPVQTKAPAPAARPAQPAAAKAAPGAPAEVDKPEAPKVNPIELQVWMGQLSLVVSMAAAVVAMSVARMHDRAWLSCVFCAAAAAIIAALGGTVLARVIGAQIISAEENKAS